MKLLPNQSVKVLFRNGTSVEGIVDIWDGDYVLRSGDGKSVLIIQNPEQDIMAVKVMLSEEEVLEKEAPVNCDEAPKKNYIDRLDTHDDTSIPTQEELRTKKLAELHMLKASQEKLDIINKLRSHSISEVKPITYGYPNVSKIKGK